MKRCPTEAGGCGDLVDILFNSGLCQKCDAQAARGTAAVGGTPPRRAGRRKLVAANGAIKEEPPRVDMLCLRGCGNPKHRGRCKKAFSALSKPKRQYRRRGAEPDPLAPDNSLLVLEQLRSQYSDERDAAMERVAAIEARLEALDEIEAKLKRARKTPGD